MDSRIDQAPLHAFNAEGNSSNIFTAIIVLVIAAALGIGAGFLLSHSIGTKTTVQSGSVNGSNAAAGTIIGSQDTSAFKDTTQGVLQNGGVSGEGQYHLVRPGGDSQNVYLTSSSVDLSQFIGKTIKVWGATQTAQHVGWLMDVGRVEVE